MSTTIFCNFDQQDLADLAVGRLRASSLAIRSIHYIGGFKPDVERTATASAFVTGFTGMTGPQIPSPPVTIKIVCADSAAAAVKSKLINMHAYQIITTR